MTRSPLLLATLACSLTSPLPAAGAGPNWLTDLGQARRAARAAGKPIFVVFRCEH
jgi:hypothetical protein